MTNRIQVLRSSVTGNTPTAGTRAAGELWTNFADLQLGTIDAARNAQRLVAVRYFSTTANYVAGDFVIQAGVLYVAKGAITAGAFNATNWTQVAAATDAGGPYLSVAAGASTYLPLAGGTMTGLLTLSGAPSNPLHAATKAYVDTMLPLAGGTMTGLVTLSGPPSNPLHAATKAYVDAGAFVPVAGGANTGLNDNRIINGDFRIDQRNNGASGTASGYTVDRWVFGSNFATKGNWGRNINSASAPVGFPCYLGFVSNSAYTPAATDYFSFSQNLEADAVSDFAWGTANAQPVTLSFWAQSSLTGTFSGTIQNYALTRSYPFTFSLPTTAWTKIVVTIPGDTAGSWVMGGNGGSVVVAFDLGTGSTPRGPANAWASTNYLGVTGAVRVVSTNAATFYVTGVKLEIGSVATPFNRESLAKSMADCQRFYQKIGGAIAYDLVIQMTSPGASAMISQMVGTAAMRAAPTIAAAGTFALSNVSAVTYSGSLQHIVIQLTCIGSGAAQWNNDPALQSLRLSAEL